MTIHEFLDTGWGAEGGETGLRERLDAGVDLEARAGAFGETALHVAVRRRRAVAVRLLLTAGADPAARTAGGKTPWQHAARRGFHDVLSVLATGGADSTLDPADRLAVALVEGDLHRARELLGADPTLARTGNPEEDRVLADLAGREATDPVRLLIDAGADLEARGLDDGTPLHQAAWFGQPANAAALIEAGAPLDVFESVHTASPLHWAAHGSRYSGGAEARQDRYVALTRMLLEAGSSLTYPGDGSDAYWRRLLRDASPRVAEVLTRHGFQA